MTRTDERRSAEKLFRRRVVQSAQPWPLASFRISSAKNQLTGVLNDSALLRNHNYDTLGERRQTQPLRRTHLNNLKQKQKTQNSSNLIREPYFRIRLLRRSRKTCDWANWKYSFLQREQTDPFSAISQNRIFLCVSRFRPLLRFDKPSLWYCRELWSIHKWCQIESSREVIQKLLILSVFNLIWEDLKYQLHNRQIISNFTN